MNTEQEYQLIKKTYQAVKKSKFDDWNENYYEDRHINCQQDSAGHTKTYLDIFSQSGCFLSNKKKAPHSCEVPSLESKIILIGFFPLV